MAATEPDLHGVALGDWRRTSPLAALYFLGRAFRAFATNSVNLIGSVGAAIAFIRTDQAALLVWIAVAGVGLLAAVAVLRYWFFRFRLDADGIQMRQGVFKKTSLDIRFDRVQSVDVEQSLVFRALGLAAVNFNTAGSAGSEGNLPAVPRPFADALRTRIDGLRRVEAAKPVEASEGADAREAVETMQGAESGVLLRLGHRDMVRVGLTDPSGLIGLPALALLLQVEEFRAALADFGSGVAATIQEIAESLAVGPLATAATVVAMFILAVAAVLLLAVIATVVAAYLRFHGFTLLRDGASLRSRAGLLTRKEVAMEQRKVQKLSLRQGVLLHVLGRCQLRLLPATSGAAAANQQGQDAQVLNVPLLDLRMARDLRGLLLGEEGASLSLLPRVDPFAPVSGHYVRAFALKAGLLPALAATAALWPQIGPASLACLGWLGLAALLGWRRWKCLGFWHDDHGLARRTGLIAYRVDAFVFRKAQGVTLSRSPLQRRKGLANLTVHLASGDVTVPYIDAGQARRLRDYILYKAESSRLPWH